MKLEIMAFGAARDLTGGSPTFEIELPEGATAAELLIFLNQKWPALGRLSSLRVAVGQTFAEGPERLFQGAEIALIPPVSGG